MRPSSSLFNVYFYVTSQVKNPAYCYNVCLVQLFIQKSILPTFNSLIKNICVKTSYCKIFYFTQLNFIATNQLKTMSLAKENNIFKHRTSKGSEQERKHYYKTQHKMHNSGC